MYLIGKDEGFARKIVFINLNSKDFGNRNIGLVMPIVERTGKDEKFRGFYATTPTIYNFTERFKEIKWEGFYRHQGSLYEKHECEHPDIVVYCHIMKLDDYQEGAAIGKFIKDLMTEFPPKRS